jgi:hypothetical protein
VMNYSVMTLVNTRNYHDYHLSVLSGKIFTALHRRAVQLVVPL